MAEFEKLLKESTGLTEEAKALIQEAWEAKLSEAKNQVTAELREEFAQRFEHDKAVLVESMGQFLDARIKAEFEEFAEDKKNLVAERVKYKTQVVEHIAKLDKFVVSTLAKEIAELKEDKAQMAANIEKLEKFVIKQLAEEVKEFHADKTALVEQRVKLVKEGKSQLVETKKEFVKRASETINEHITKVLKEELVQYRNDIKAARENAFGRKLFEAFAGEYMTSYLNEGSEVKKLQKMLEAKDKELADAAGKITEQKKLTESVDLKLRASQNEIAREKTLNKLLSPLGKEKKAVMEELLATVKTENLTESFNKYLPAVLNETVSKNTQKKEIITEKTGNRANGNTNAQEDNSDAVVLQSMKKLAGIIK